MVTQREGSWNPESSVELHNSHLWRDTGWFKAGSASITFKTIRRLGTAFGGGHASLRHDCTPYCGDLDPTCCEIPVPVGTWGSGGGIESPLSEPQGSCPSSMSYDPDRKQGANGFPVYRRAHVGYFHVDFKARTQKQVNRKIQAFFQLRCVGQFTSWGYGEICRVLQKINDALESSHPVNPQFRILKWLPSKLTRRERQLLMAALLHDVVDTNIHPTKLGRFIKILDPYMQCLCEHHHALKDHPTNPDLQLLQEADIRTSRYARLIPLSTSCSMMAPVNTQQLARQLEQAAQCSIYKLYSVIYHSQELNSLTASKLHPTESLRNHLIGVANWTLFLFRTRTSASLPASAALAGQSGGTPDPVEMEDPQDQDEP